MVESPFCENVFERGGYFSDFEYNMILSLIILLVSTGIITLVCKVCDYNLRSLIYLRWRFSINCDRDKIDVILIRHLTRIRREQNVMRFAFIPMDGDNKWQILSYRTLDLRSQTSPNAQHYHVVSAETNILMMRFLACFGCWVIELRSKRNEYKIRYFATFEMKMILWSSTKETNVDNPWLAIGAEIHKLC